MKQEKVNINVNPSDTLPIVCEECGSDKFRPIFFLRKISKFMTGESEDRVMPIDSLACLECSHVNRQFQPFPNENKNKKDE
jgi:hypothetical protein